MAWYRKSQSIDAKYFDALRENDIDSAKRMVDEAANSAGFTQRAWHQTGGDSFTAFDPDVSYDGGFWFTTDQGTIERGETGAGQSGRVMECWLNTGNEAGWDEYDKSSPIELARDGFDSARLDGDIVVFSPARIKSANIITYDNEGKAIPLSERFNVSNSDVRW